MFHCFRGGLGDDDDFDRAWYFSCTSCFDNFGVFDAGKSQVSSFEVPWTFLDGN